MITVRDNTFETNSSSTHSLVIDTEANIQKFIKGELWKVDTSEVKSNLCDRAAIIEYLKKKGEPEDFIKEVAEAEHNYEVSELPERKGYDWEFQLFDNWYEELECEDGTYTTPGGETIAWVARYGYLG